MCAQKLRLALSLSFSLSLLVVSLLSLPRDQSLPLTPLFPPLRSAHKANKSENSPALRSDRIFYVGVVSVVFKENIIIKSESASVVLVLL